MGFIDEIKQAAGSKLPGGSAQGGLMDQVLGLVNSPEIGGFAGLVEKFKSKGLGDAISSWIGPGENKPVSGEAITDTLGSDRVQEIAGKLGVSESEASNGLAALLPRVIDKLTPDGRVPEGGLLEQGLSILRQKLL
jgi:uncharacterized protein YidB (DUF937 family)